MYLNDSKCVQCNSTCTKGCRRANDCNLCYDALCLKCTSFEPGCEECITNAQLNDLQCECKPGFYLKENNCMPCENECDECFGEANNCTDCYSNSTIINGICICDEGFFMQSKICIICDNSCKTCSESYYYNCISCYEENVLLLGMCYEKCPLGFSKSEFICIQTSHNQMSKFEFDQLGNLFIDSYSKLALQSISIVTSIPAYGRGLYFTGNNSGLISANNENFLIFSPSFCISIWFNPYQDSPIFEYHSSLYKSIQIFSSSKTPEIKANFSLILSQKASIPYLNSSWNHLLTCLEFNNFYTVSINLNKQASKSTFYTLAPFKDSLNSSILIGKSEFSDVLFKGFISSLYFFQSQPNIEELVDDNCGACEVCRPKASCIPTCGIFEFPGSDIECYYCHENCTEGCRNDKNCKTCADEGCALCQNFEKQSCILCDDGFQPDGKQCKLCSKTQFFNFNNRLCESCKNLCLTCSDGNNCLTCKSNSNLTLNNSCECVKGYTNIKNDCIRNIFRAIIKVSSFNDISLLFTESLEKYLNFQSFIIQNSNKTVNFTLTPITTSNYIINLNQEITESSLEYFLIFIRNIESAENSILSPLNYSFILNKRPDDPVIKEIEEMKSYAQSITNSGIASVFGASVLSGDPTSFFTFLNTAEIFSYAILFNSTFDPLLIAFLNALKPSSIIPNPFEKIINKEKGNTLEKKYQDFGIDTSFILLNAGVYFIILSVFFLLALISLFLSYFRKEFTNKVNKYLKDFLFFNAFLRLWVQSCLEVTFAAILGILNGETDEFYSFFDYCLCVLALNFSLFCFGILVYSVIKLGKISDSEQLKLHKSKFSTFFDEFKCEKPDEALFYILFVLRRYSLCFIIYFVKPFVLQISISICFTLAIIFYILFGEPFKEKIFGFDIVCLELLTSAYYVMLVLQVLFPHRINSSTIGQYCIKLITAAIFCNIGFSALITLKKLFIFIKEKIFKRTLKVQEMQTTTHNNPILKIDRFT